jgi:lysine-arginine-ornithine-binding protein
MNKLLGLIAAAAVALSAGSALAEMQKVRVGTEGAYPPFNYIDDNGELKGFDVDIANALCEAAKFDCEFVVQDWDGIIPGLIAEKYDAIIASMSITAERKEVVDFTDKYYNTPAKFVRAKDSGIEVPDDLEGKTVGVQSATIHENFLRDNFGDVVEIQTYGSQEDANLDMVAGRVDLLLADSVALDEGFLQTEDGAGFEFVGPDYNDPQWFGEGAGIAVRKGEDDLREKLNAAIAQILEDGTYKEINDKYFPYDVYGSGN